MATATKAQINRLARSFDAIRPRQFAPETEKELWRKSVEAVAEHIVPIRQEWQNDFFEGCGFRFLKRIEPKT